MSQALKMKMEIRFRDEYKTIRFEYLDKAELKHLLHNRVKVNHAILQAFVEPRDDYNNTIYVDWSRTHCIIERRFSKVKLYDQRYSVQQRGSTFEKLEGVTEKVNITSKSILQAINEEIYELCEHIHENSPKNYHINNLKVMMKIDKKGRLNLLWVPYIQASKMDYPRNKRRRHKKHKRLSQHAESRGTLKTSSSMRRQSSVMSYKTSKM